MNFGLLLSQLPHVDESRTHYEAMLDLDGRKPLLVRCLQRIRAIFA
ncbi:hypothetical protein [Burkholderia gladioli]|nr:hypothetical protein [Burkholderia gladioli]